MVSRLTPLRRIEAKRLITNLFARKQFDADLFAELLAGVMIDAPDVVAVAAQYLEKWNNYDGDHQSESPRFVMQDADEGYASIAEVVLDAAAIYRGETTEEPNECMLPHVTGLLTNEQVRSYLSQAASHLRAVASGKTDRKRSETHASRLESIVASMDDAGKSSLPFPLGYPTAEDRNTEGLADDKKV
jgi:hypothetical protein